MTVDSIDVPASAWDKVLKALENRKFDFRTADGISRETGLTVEDVQTLLQKHQTEVRKAYTTDGEGRLLYTLRDRPQTIREVLATVKAMVSASSST